MDDDLKKIKALLKEPVTSITAGDPANLQKQILSMVTDLTEDKKQKLDTIARLFIKVYTADREYFHAVIPPFLDFMRNNPSVDLFTLMLEDKDFNTSDLATMINQFINNGVFSIFDLEAMVPRGTTKTRKISLLAKLLKKAPEGVMQDTVLSLLVELVMPQQVTMLNPEMMFNMDFLNEISKSIQTLITLHRKGYQASLILAKIGENNGPQFVMFMLMMMGQFGLTDQEAQEILDKFENPMFQTMFFQAKKSMESMLPQGMQGRAGMMPMPGAGASKLMKNSLFQKFAGRLMKFFTRFRKF
ncbi:MAG: hypothetical protein ACFFCS_10055 [Candidatus Hodarchaeota archaeon]